MFRARMDAVQGCAEAQNVLGFMSGEGQGVPQDYVQTHMWYNLAASKHPLGEVRNKAVKTRDILAEKMTPAQIAEAQKLAREWKPKQGRVPGRPASRSCSHKRELGQRRGADVRYGSLADLSTGPKNGLL